MLETKIEKLWNQKKNVELFFAWSIFFCSMEREQLLLFSQVRKKIYRWSKKRGFIYWLWVHPKVQTYWSNSNPSLFLWGTLLEELLDLSLWKKKFNKVCVLLLFSSLISTYIWGVLSFARAIKVFEYYDSTPRIFFDQKKNYFETTSLKLSL